MMKIFCEWKYLLFNIWIGDIMIMTQWTYKNVAVGRGLYVLPSSLRFGQEGQNKTHRHTN